jgi:uncharacterized membrane protein HdeD (DUF308 family)
MLDLLASRWWLLALRGAAAVLFGILALFWPHVTLLVLAILFGAYVLVEGIVEVTTTIARPGPWADRGPLVVFGVLGIAVGLITWTWPGITVLVLLWLVAAWAIVTGVLEIAAAIRLRREITNEWLMGASGALSVLLGLILLFRTGAGAVAVAWLIGLFALVWGLVLLGLAFRLRRLHRSRHGGGHHGSGQVWTGRPDQDAAW